MRSLGNENRAVWEFTKHEEEHALFLEITDKYWAKANTVAESAKVFAHVRVSRKSLHCEWIQAPKSWNPFRRLDHEKFLANSVWQRLKEIKVVRSETKGTQVFIPWTDSLEIVHGLKISEVTHDPEANRQ